MSLPAKQFPYVARESSLGEPSLAPMLELNLIGERSVMAFALVDSGAAVNVLPYFFMEFDICFFRSRGLFEVRPKP